MSMERQLAELGEMGTRASAALELVARQSVASARIQGGVAAMQKADRSPVTVIDLLHQTQVQDLLLRRFPDDGLICEEPRALQEQVLEEARRLSESEYGLPLPEQLSEPAETGRRVWMLDPIDGTKGFLAGRCFAIALGCFDAGEAAFGILAVPAGDPASPCRVDGALAFAAAGRGAWWSRDQGRSWETLDPGLWEAGRPMRIAVSLAHAGSLGERLAAEAGIELVRLDSQAKYLAVACGEIDGYLRAARDDGQGDVAWDHMPAGVIAREAGCEVRHFTGRPLEFAPEERIVFEGGLLCCRPSRKGVLLSRLLELTACSS